jgi:hypothetical protein
MSARSLLHDAVYLAHAALPKQSDNLIRTEHRSSWQCAAVSLPG